MIELAPVDLADDRAPEIAAFTRVAAPFDLLSSASVRRSIYADPDPQAVWGHYDGGLEAVCVPVVRGDRGFVKFLAVHPRVRRKGIGSALLGRAEAFCREHGVSEVEVGASAPYYVVPGLDVRITEGVGLLEGAGYERRGEAVNLSAPLRDVPEPPLPVETATDADLDALRDWVAEEHPTWLVELERAVALGTCVAHGGRAFCCFDVNRDGWVGPMATRTADRGRGLGAAVLLGALHRLAARGHERAEIAWAEALPFYAKTCGARVSRVFWRYRKRL